MAIEADSREQQVPSSDQMKLNKKVNLGVRPYKRLVQRFSTFYDLFLLFYRLSTPVASDKQ